ncbi:hypothetical protein F4805DRAFT_88410 [Annulohypoxylon moriforme]|nr:hypothetical protein F4805DRAFT_88410 [Annulohypoxylon moriforme]
MAGIEGASAIAGLFSLGIQVTTALYTVANGIGAAGEEVRDVARDVDSATQIMKTIQNVLDRQPHVNDDIRGVVKRIMGICDEIFKIYHVLQKSLIPLLERFQNSERKLEQFGLRLKWYFRSKEKVTGCRHSLQQQIAMLTPILMLLNFDRSDAAQNNYYVQNIQVKYILENSAASLQRSVSNNSQRRLSTHSSRSTLPPPGRGRAESSRASSTEDDDISFVDVSQKTPTTSSEILNDQTALIRYNSSNNDDESLSREEDEEVVETLDTSLDTIDEENFELVSIETRSARLKFSQLVRRLLDDIKNKSEQTNAEDENSSPAETSKPEPKVVDQEGKWTKINRQDGTASVFPVDTIDTQNKFILALRDLGYDVSCVRPRFLGQDEFISLLRRKPESVSLRDDALECVLDHNQINIHDSDDSVIIPGLWERHSGQGRTLSVKMRRSTPVQNGLSLEEALVKKMRKGLRV